jgi:Zn-dependent protease/predicted transcriptional regulator
MKGSWRIGRVAGIDVYVHFTFLILVAWVLAVHWIGGASPASAIGGAGFVLAIFGCVLLHELGHALAARRYGIGTRDILLLPIGGVARLERFPERPSHELVVSLAGPVVNLGIAGFLFVWLVVTSQLVPLSALGWTSGPWLERLLAVNLFLAAFNMIPAFPMDGGRVLRALMTLRTGPVRATRIAAAVGRGFAVVFAIAGLFVNPFLLLIAAFVWLAGRQESILVETRGVLGGIPVRRAMKTEFRALWPDDRVETAVEWMLSSSQREFPVVAAEGVVGLVTSRTLASAMRHGRGNAPLAQIMRRDFPVAAPHDPLDDAFLRLLASEDRTMPVIHDRQLVGLLTIDNVEEFASVQSIRTRSRGRRDGRILGDPWQPAGGAPPRPVEAVLR